MSTFVTGILLELSLEYEALGFSSHLSDAQVDIYQKDWLNLRYHVVSIDCRKNEIKLWSCTTGGIVHQDIWCLEDSQAFLAIREKILSYECNNSA